MKKTINLSNKALHKKKLREKKAKKLADKLKLNIVKRKQINLER